jgi:hypothetical protein
MGLLIAAGVVVGLAGVGHVGGVGGAWGEVGARLIDGGLMVVWADAPMAWDGQRWEFSGPRGPAALGTHPPGRLIPESRVWVMGWLGAPATRITVRVTWVPLWPPAFLLAAVAAVAWWGEFRAGRPGVCGQCGYDLRGLSGRCPECGAGAAV